MQKPEHIFPIDPLHLDEALIARAAELLRNGALVAFPTETVYGLGANALDPHAVEAIFHAKGRPATNPLIAHVPDTDAAKALVKLWPETAQKLADTFWPGPITIVLPKQDFIPDIVTAGGATVAIRIPAHPVALALLRATGKPVAAPSANKSTRLSPVRAIHVARNFTPDQVPMILDGGVTSRGIESVVIDLTEENGPRILRPGVIPQTVIEKVLGQPVLTSSGPITDSHTAHIPARSPGLMTRHYAPRTPLYLCHPGTLKEYAETLSARGLNVYLLTLPNTPDEAAAMLYEKLHNIDSTGQYNAIVLEMPPETQEWAGVLDRIKRAAVK